MKKIIVIVTGLAISFCVGYSFNTSNTKQYNNYAIIKQPINKSKEIKKEDKIKLGAFSISLSVKDINASKKFYETLGFDILGGDIKKNYLIMKNENSVIGLFQGMFQNNILTFNPGWDQNGKNVDEFMDVRNIQKQLKNKSISIIEEANEKTTGPASFMVKDPDGNLILFDQHR